MEYSPTKQTKKRELSEMQLVLLETVVSEFRGDAIAGIIIMGINILGGLVLGVIQKGLDVSQAAEFYTRLTIGDGLVSQIPALIISTAAGIVVTRNHSKGNMGTEMAGQLFLNPRAVGMASGSIFVLGLVPGLPTIPFTVVAFLLGGCAWLIMRYKREEVEDHPHWTIQK